jgi:hypothetical protein
LSCYTLEDVTSCLENTVQRATENRSDHASPTPILKDVIVNLTNNFRLPVTKRQRRLATTCGPPPPPLCQAISYPTFRQAQCTAQAVCEQRQYKMEVVLGRTRPDVLIFTYLLQTPCGRQQSDGRRVCHHCNYLHV